MTTIACTLTTAGYRRRITDLSELARDGLRSTAPIEGGFRHVFADLPGIRERLRRAVAAEAECCAFLTLSLRDSDEGLVLDVTGPREAQPVIAELFRRDLQAA